MTFALACLVLALAYALNCQTEPKHGDLLYALNAFALVVAAILLGAS